MFQMFFGLWFHEITHIWIIYFLNPSSLANQEMLISTMILVWNGSKNYSNWGVIIFHPIWAFFPIRICRKILILGPRWFAKSNGYVPFQWLSNRKFPEFFKTHPTFICRSILKSSRSLQTKGASFIVGGCMQYVFICMQYISFSLGRVEKVLEF